VKAIVSLLAFVGVAASPVTLAAALDGLSAFERSSLAPLEREVIAMTMGQQNACHYCVTLTP